MKTIGRVMCVVGATAIIAGVMGIVFAVITLRQARNDLFYQHSRD